MKAECNASYWTLIILFDYQQRLCKEGMHPMQRIDIRLLAAVSLLLLFPCRADAQSTEDIAAEALPGKNIWSPCG